MSVWIMTEERGWRPFAKVCSNSNDLHGVYMPQTTEAVRQEIADRLPRFLAANAIGNRIDKEHFFRGDSFIEPIFGAFGEKL